MKTTITKIVSGLLIFISIGCQVQQHDVCTTSPIALGLPPHKGCGKDGKYGLYDYTSYKDSVSVVATSPDMNISEADVYDLNQDGKLDSVYIQNHGVWQFVSSLPAKERPFENSASAEYLRDYIGLGNHVQKLAKEKDRINPIESMSLNKLNETFVENFYELQ